MPQQEQRHLEEVLAGIARVSPVIPAQRALHRAGFSFSHEPFEVQLPTWNYIWKRAGTLRGQLQAFFFLEKHLSKKQLLQTVWHTSRDWQEDVDDWPLCDALAKLNSHALVAHPEDIYRQLEIWNRSENPWKRRQSMVSLLYYARTKKSHPAVGQITRLVTPLLADEAYYVQKGLGWTLRELYNVYPADALAYLHNHVQHISALAFTTAIEKLDEPAKNELKALRRQQRIRTAPGSSL